MCKVLKCENYGIKGEEYCIKCQDFINRDHEYYLKKEKEEKENEENLS